MIQLDPVGNLANKFVEYSSAEYSAGETLTAGKIVYKTGVAKQVKLASNAIPACLETVVGVTRESAALLHGVEVAHSGLIDFVNSFTIGAVLYLGTSGDFTVTPPDVSSGLIRQRLGVVVSAKQILLLIGNVETTSTADNVFWASLPLFVEDVVPLEPVVNEDGNGWVFPDINIPSPTAVTTSFTGYAHQADVDMLKGTVVYQTGSANRVAKAGKDISACLSKVVGVTVKDALTDELVLVGTEGTIPYENGYAIGTVMYLDTFGGITPTPPAAGSGHILQKIGVVTSAMTLRLQIGAAIQR